MDLFSGQLFNNLLEIIAPSPAPKDASEDVAAPVVDIEVGLEINLQYARGEVFPCQVPVHLKSPGAGIVRQKYYLLVTESQIVEMYPHTIRSGVGVVVDVHPLQSLVKLKFKKGTLGLMVLEYKNGKVSKLVLDEPAECVSVIKMKMQMLGISGSVKNKADKASENAQVFFVKAKAIENQFSMSPSVEYIQEMMDLLRSAAEKFSEVNDHSYKEVIDFMRGFLQRADVVKVLDDSVEIKTSNNKVLSPIPHDNSMIIEMTETPQSMVATPFSYQSALAETPFVDKSSLYYDTNLYQTPFVKDTAYIPDINAELSSMKNAIMYHFEEDEEDESSSLSKRIEETLVKNRTRSGSAPGDHAHSELEAMLDKMNNEFGSLLSSFDHSTNVENETIIDDIITNSEESDMMEFDFEKGFSDIENMLKS